MATRIVHFSTLSHFCKSVSNPFGRFFAKKKFTSTSVCPEIDIQFCRSLYSCKHLRKKPYLGWRGIRLKFKWVRSLAGVSNYGPKTANRFYSRGRKTSKDTKVAKKLESASENDDLDEDIEILEKLRDEAGLDHGHNVLVVQPDFKWGRNRFHLETVGHMLGEAISLVESISGWSVVESRTEPIRKPDGRHFFGKGKLEELTKLVKKLKGASMLSAVFLDVGRLSRRQHSELEELWQVKVFDRFSLVVQIFKERAVSSEAKVQVELAELGYIRSRLIQDDLNSYDQQRGGSHSIGGGGETHLEVARRMLMLRQQKLKKKLEAIKKQRSLIRHDRAKRKVPIVSVVGYTNAGKTTLIKALTHDSEMRPEDKLFATLDVTAHRGKLPCGMNALFIDTVGFISDLPHELVESFSATLEDIVHSDLLIHLRDCSHPEFEAQKVHVLDVLKMLRLPKYLMENIIEVHNKVDLRESISDASGTSEECFEVSALHETGLNALWLAVEEALFRTTGRQRKTIVIPHDGPQLSWLHHETTVCETETIQDDRLKVEVIMDEAALGKYNSKFGKID
ncbi:putative GTP-binding protein 6 [Dendronephthya gigantea]|uniref:putative GTP-binding protein 6 n=1 Tax=Dendronephthya gigantea TaxID=151771 RepID=UPI00106AD541|nr:putative GTP-binding protein 6 [Dendronephthya gigantea]